MWNSDEYIFEQFIIRGKGFDPNIFEIREVKPPTIEHAYWEIDFHDGAKMITSENVSLHFRKKKKAEEGVKSVRIG